MRLFNMTWRSLSLTDSFGQTCMTSTRRTRAIIPPTTRRNICRSCLGRRVVKEASGRSASRTSPPLAMRMRAATKTPGAHSVHTSTAKKSSKRWLTIWMEKVESDFPDQERGEEGDGDHTHKEMMEITEMMATRLLNWKFVRCIPAKLPTVQ